MTLLCLSELNQVAAAAKAQPPADDVHIESTMRTAYPLFDVATRKVYLGAAFVARVQDGANQHTVVLALSRTPNGLRVHLGCGDKFFDCLHGLDRTEAKKRCTDSVPASAQQLLQEMQSGHSLFPMSAACNFFIGWRAERKLCRHTTCVLADFAEQYSDLALELERQLDAYEELCEPVGDTGTEFDLNYFAFKAPVLLLGERGSGKTTLARSLAKEKGAQYVEMAGHEEVDAIDMLGTLVPYRQGELVWKDGPVSAAFRAARTRRVVLAFDELLRIDQRQLSFLLTTLSPDDGVYRLRTGRIFEVLDGVASEETLECACTNLCVVASSNIGSDYAVGELDPALADRFVILEYNATKALVRKYVLDACLARDFSSGAAEVLVECYSRLSDMKKAGALRFAPSARLMVNTVRLAPEESALMPLLNTLVVQLAARDLDGRPIRTQLEDAHQVISRCFGIAPTS